VLIVALGAVLPLALVGLWLTRSAQRSGTELLRTQIEHAASAIAAEIDGRWALRAGELQLLAGNSVARALVSGATLTSTDSAYLQQLARSLGGAIPSIAYVDRDGTERWRVVAQPIDGRMTTRTFAIELPITEGERTVGTLEARVNLASVLAPEAEQTLVPGATLTIVDARGMVLTNAPDSLDASSPAPAREAGWEVASRAPQAAPLRVIVAAPASPYVTPFEHAARLGVGVLLVVSLVALVLSIVLATRVTRSLQRLADAAGAVAAGDLQRRVDVPVEDDVGRVAQSFNAMTDSLRRTLSELAGQRALAAVGEFAASLSHEVRNSLTAVRVDLQHATRHLPADETGARLVARALDSVRRLDATVSGALRVARSGHVDKHPVDLHEVLLRAMRAAEPSFAEHGALLEALDGASLPHVEGDGAALEQMFLNLLINAAQASPPGGRVRVELVPAGAHVTVRVVDAGHGMRAVAASTIGAPFQSTKDNGTGLGLPIARRIAMAHAGELTFESNDGAGTTALVSLPVLSRPAASHPV
jgi:signal transduction histidine kinase